MGIELQLKFVAPLAISQGKNNDELGLGVKTPEYFVSALSGERWDAKHQSGDKSGLTVSIPV